VIGWGSIDEYTFPATWANTQSAKIQAAYKQRVTEDEKTAKQETASDKQEKLTVTTGL
jgi:hypothetical protein